MRKLNSYKLLIFAITLLATLSCEEVTEWELQPGQNDRLVVDAILTDEFTTQEIRLSLSYAGLNDSTPAVEDAIVTVEVNGQINQFLAVANTPGLYQSASPFAVLANLDYELEIEWQGARYRAVSRLSDVAPIPEVVFQEGLEEDEVSLRPFSVNSTNQQAMYDIFVDWSHLNDKEPNQLLFRYYTFNTLNVNQFLLTPEEIQSFPIGSIVVVSKYGLNDDFANYLRGLITETNWNGGLLYSTPSTVPSNVSNDALGFYSTCAVLRDTFIAE